MLRVLVIDGQGGGIGSRFIACLREICKSSVEIIAIGANSTAASAMLKAGADSAATGENPVVVCAPRCDVIVGPVAIILANSLLGEITPKMAEAVASSDAEKLLIPFTHSVGSRLSHCSVTIIGTAELSPDAAVRMAAERVKAICQ